MRPVYTITFTGAELDLLYELARDARNNLPDPDDIPEIGSWANKALPAYIVNAECLR